MSGAVTSESPNTVTGSYNNKPSMMMSEPIFNNMLPPQYKLKTDEVLNLVKSKEAFLENNGFLNYLHWKTWSPTWNASGDNQINAFKSAQSTLLLMENVRSYRLMQSDISLFDPALPTNIPERNEAIKSLVRVIIENYDNPLPAIGPATHGSVVSDYLMAHQNVCKQILMSQYQQIRNYPPSAGFPIESSFTTDQAAIFVSKAIQVVSNINTNYYTTFTSYFDAVIEAILSPTAGSAVSAISGSTIPMRNIFLSAFYTYFQMRYTASLIALREDTTSDNNAPRILLVRRIAILAIYMYQYWFAYLTYLLLIRVDFSTTEASRMRSILDNLSTYIFEQEKETGMLDIGELHKITQTNYEKSRRVNEKYQEINLGRNNLNKAINNDVGINDQYKNARIIRLLITVWVLAVIIALAVLVFLKMYRIAYIAGGANLIILVISAFVSLVRNI